MCEFWRQNTIFEQKDVKITTRAGSLQGHLHAVDPESGTACLMSLSHTFHLIQPDHILHIESCEQPLSPRIRAFPVNVHETSQVLSAHDILQAFLQRRIKAALVRKDDMLMVSIFDGMAIVKPPYGALDCVCENENVMAKVVDILSQIREDTGK